MGTSFCNVILVHSGRVVLNLLIMGEDKTQVRERSETVFLGMCEERDSHFHDLPAMDIVHFLESRRYTTPDGCTISIDWPEIQGAEPTPYQKKFAWLLTADKLEAAARAYCSKITLGSLGSINSNHAAQTDENLIAEYKNGPSGGLFFWTRAAAIALRLGSGWKEIIGDDRWVAAADEKYPARET